MSAAAHIQAASDELTAAQRVVVELQEACGPSMKGPPDIGSSALWGRLEYLGDKLHEALVKLGG